MVVRNPDERIARGASALADAPRWRCRARYWQLAIRTPESFSVKEQVPPTVQLPPHRGSSQVKQWLVPTTQHPCGGVGGQSAGQLALVSPGSHVPLPQKAHSASVHTCPSTNVSPVPAQVDAVARLVHEVAPMQHPGGSQVVGVAQAGSFGVLMTLSPHCATDSAAHCSGVNIPPEGMLTHWPGPPGPPRIQRQPSSRAGVGALDRIRPP